MIRRRKPYSQMNADELRAATTEFDREFVRETFGLPSTQAKASLAEARRKGRTSSGKGSAKVPISVERELLKQADAFARRHRMSRSQIVAAGLRRVLGAA